MMYMGGKLRIGRRIASEVYTRTKHRHVVEPFCGSGSVTVQLVRLGFTVEAYDAHPALVSMLQAVKDGWLPPVDVSESEYAAAKELPDSDPRKAAIGFGASFGGKYFGGYARGDARRNYASGASIALAKKAHHFRRVTFVHSNFFGIAPRGDVALYCDPPYAGTTGYVVGAFDSDAFWARAQEWADAGADVFVSEYSGPVEPVTTFERNAGLRKKDGTKAVEKLFHLKAAT